MARHPRALPLLIAATALGVSVTSAWAQQASPRGAPGVSQPVPPVAGGVNWQTLNGEQKNALRPLAALWPTLTGDQQRKWVALTRNYGRLSAGEQATLQSRMTEWATLTPAQRTQARLNFGEARRLPVDERKARWEEYQSLTPEERQRLAADHAKPPPGTAPALRPTPQDKLLRPRQGEDRKLPIYDNTLLPR